MEGQLSLIEVLRMLKKRFLVILVVSVIFTSATAGWSLFVMKPVYEATAMILVSKTTSENTISKLDLDTNRELIETYGVIVKSPRILKKISNQVDYEIDDKNIIVSGEGQSQIMNISVRDENKERGVELANLIANTLVLEIPKIMKMDSIEILSSAELPEKPISPNLLLNLIIGVCLGIIFGIITAYTYEYLKHTIQTEKDVEDYLDTPLLGVVMAIEKDRINPLSLIKKKKSKMFKILRKEKNE